MSYRIPDFPLAVNIWRQGNYPGTPDVVTTGNLSPGKRVSVQWWDWDTSGSPTIPMQLLLPAFTDIRGFNSAAGPDTCECPAGSGRVYLVQMVDDLGKGFPNEHRFALLSQLLPWPDPIP